VVAEYTCTATVMTRYFNFNNSSPSGTLARQMDRAEHSAGRLD
jgi:hypothetical protein